MMIKAVMADMADVTEMTSKTEAMDENSTIDNSGKNIYDEKVGKFDRTLLELWAGIGLAGLLGQVVVFFVDQKVYFTIGWWYGIVLSLFMAWHMWRSIDRGLDLGDDASSYLSKANIIRYVIVAVAYIALAVLDFGNPIAAFFGIIMLKVAAYIQPFTHKCFKKMFGWEDLFPPGISDELDFSEENSLESEATFESNGTLKE